jgi:16S rRNA C967 or C1407 C5-methylase (RsmB/RsmF family)
LEYLH